MRFAQNGFNILAIQARNGDRCAGATSIWDDGFPPASSGPDGDSTVSTGNTWDKRNAATMTFNFDIAETSEFYFRPFVWTAGRNCWMWLELDGDQLAIGNNNFGRILYNTDVHQWSDGIGEPDDNRVTLTAGSHTLTLRSISFGLYFGKVAFVPVTDTLRMQDGDTSLVGSTQIITDTTTPIVKTTGYNQWLNDTTRDQFRILLIDLEHSAGTVRLSSLPWISPNNIIYDDFLLNRPYMENSLAQLADLGDMQAINPDTESNWLNHQWSGFKFRWLFGDTSWRLDEFRTIASGTIEGIRRVGDRRYRFDLVSEAQRFNRTFATADSTEDRNLHSSINWLFDHFPSANPFNYINLERDHIVTRLLFSVTDNTRMIDLMRLFATSIGGFVRISQTGVVEFLRPDFNGPIIDINSDVSIQSTMRIIETIPAVETVVVEYNDGNSSVSGVTEAATGSLSETATIETVLRDQSDAQALLDEMIIYRSITHHVWEIEVHGVIDLIQVGDVVEVVHPEIHNLGVVNRVRRTPLSRINKIEVII